jgi:predicted ATPase
MAYDREKIKAPLNINELSTFDSLKNILARLQKEYPEAIKIHQDMALVRRGLQNKIIALAEKK